MGSPAGEIAYIMTADEIRVHKAMQKLIADEAKLASGATKWGKEGARAGKRWKRALSAPVRDVAAMATGFLSVHVAVGMAQRGFETWVTNLRDIQTEAKRAGDQVIALAALQEGGEAARAVLMAQDLAIRYGVTDRGQAFDTFQAMQSLLGGDKMAARGAAETIFKGKHAGIPVELGRELEILGISAGADPGHYLRLAFAAGEAGGRTPAAAARAAPGLAMWDDAVTGFAASAVLAGQIPEAEIATYTKALGIALSSTSNLAETYVDLGVAEATRLERLKALKAAGLDTEETLVAAGMTEMRQRLALIQVMKRIPEVEAARAAIVEQAVPGVLVAEREAVEAGLPTTRLSREIDIIQAGVQASRAFGPASVEAMIRDQKDWLRGWALTNLGLETGVGWKDLVDTEGRAIPTAWPWLRGRDLFGFQDLGGQLLAEEQRLRAQFGLAEEGPEGGLDELRRLNVELQKLRGEIEKQNTARDRGVVVTQEPE